MNKNLMDDQFPCHCGCVVYIDDEFVCDECGVEWSPLELAIWETNIEEEEWAEFVANH